MSSSEDEDEENFLPALLIDKVNAIVTGRYASRRHAMLAIAQMPESVRWRYIVRRDKDATS